MSPIPALVRSAALACLTCFLGCTSSDNTPSATAGAGGAAGGAEAGVGGSAAGAGGSGVGGGGSGVGGAYTGGAVSQGGSAGTGSGGDGHPAGNECGSVRLTQYTAEAREWCGFDRTHASLPDFVRAGMTTAIAEPYNGSSYKGAPGEACGECWEVDTLVATQLVMVHDLCPIQGNPVCAGDHFHFDLSGEAAKVLGGNGEAAVRRVPCPVTGNIQARLSDRNQWGYLKVAFFNHRFPIRTAEYRAVGGQSWLPLERCLARWCVSNDKTTFASAGPGGVFRLTSATGEIVESTTTLTYALGDETVLDTGVQFAPLEPQGATCQFVPPGAVYDEGWGGIPGVQWEINTWGSPTVSEVSAGCADSSPACLLIGTFEAGDGFHIVYPSSFPANTFAHLSLRLKAQTGQGTVEVAPRSKDSRCPTTTTAQVGADWTVVDIDIAASCKGFSELRGLTVSHPSTTLDLLVDEIQFK